MKTTIPALLLAALLPAVLPLAAAGQPAPPQTSTVPLRNGVYLLRGGSNAVLAVGTDGAVLVDSEFRNPDGLLQRIADITSVPVRYVVNTHAHPDHTGGNVRLAGLGAIIVATEGAADAMAQPFAGPNGREEPPIDAAGLPRETFQGSRTIVVGGQEARIIEAPRSHSASDAYVHFPAANVIVMGDLHHSNEYPVYDANMGCRCGSFEGNLQAYDAMLALADDDTLFVPGHGGPTNRREVAAYVAMLRRVRDEVSMAIGRGLNADDVVALRLLADDRSPTWPGPDNRDAFIRVLFNALTTGVGR